MLRGNGYTSPSLCEKLITYVIDSSVVQVKRSVPWLKLAVFDSGLVIEGITADSTRLVKSHDLGVGTNGLTSF